jgi:hypothetical protein
VEKSVREAIANQALLGACLAIPLHLHVVNAHLR